MSIDVEDFIEQVLSLAKTSEDYEFQSRNGGSKRGDSLRVVRDRKLADIAPLVTADSIVTIVKYYEARIAKLEAESIRMAIMREVVREVVREEQAK